MKSKKINNDNSCDKCFFKEKKQISRGDEITAWCWRFDFQTQHSGYCTDKYFICKEDGKMKYGVCSPEIAGYILRQKDFDKAESNKQLINFSYTIIGIVIGVLLGHLFSS